MGVVCDWCHALFCFMSWWFFVDVRCGAKPHHRCRFKKHGSWHRRLGWTDTPKPWKGIEKPSRSLSVMSNKNRVKPNAFIFEYPRRCGYEVGFHYVLEYMGSILTLRCVWMTNIWFLNTVQPNLREYGSLNWPLWCGWRKVLKSISFVSKARVFWNRAYRVWNRNFPVCVLWSQTGKFALQYAFIKLTLC